METETQKELEWKEPMDVPEGNHTGVITKVEFREEPYSYTDIFIKLDDVDIEIKYGCPTVLSKKSKLGKLMEILGEVYAKGKKVNVAEVLKGKSVQFMTINKKEDDGREFARIVEDSIKLHIA